MENYADSLLGNVKKTLMRRSLTMHNPRFIKSGADGRVYKKTGNVVNTDFVKPKGKVYVVPPIGKITGYDILKPFQALMDKKLKEKGFTPPSSIADKSKLFFNHAVAAKGFNGTKPVNFESVDHADAQVDDNVITQLVTYFKSLVEGQQPNGMPLATQDAKLSTDAKAVVQDLTSKVAAAGLSPQDAAKAGANLSTTPPVQVEPFYKKQWVKWVAIAVVVIIVIKVVF